MISEASRKEETAIVTAPAPAKTTDNTQEVANELARVLQGLKTNATIDADMVRKIMREELPSLIPITRLEIIDIGIPRDIRRIGPCD
jgi:hypothetical protein